jgi:hypothetical protein
MQALLIDIGALAVFLAYVAIVYWHAVSGGEPKPRRTHAARPTGLAGSPGLDLLHEQDLARAGPAVTSR